jgi:hypothetical protein
MEYGKVISSTKWIYKGNAIPEWEVSKLILKLLLWNREVQDTKIVLWKANKGSGRDGTTDTKIYWKALMIRKWQN